MNGYGGAEHCRTHITNEFGGVHEYVGREKHRVDERRQRIVRNGRGAKLYSTENSDLKTIALQTTCMLGESVTPGTDRNMQILAEMRVFKRSHRYGIPYDC